MPRSMLLDNLEILCTEYRVAKSPCTKINAWGRPLDDPGGSGARNGLARPTDPRERVQH